MIPNFRVFSLTGIATLALVAACADKPAKNVNTAQTELTNSELEAQRESNELRQQQARERAKASDQNVEERTTLQSQQQQETAAQRADNGTKISAAEQNLDTKKAKLEQARRDFQTTANERLTKLDARAQEYKTKSAKLGGSKKAKFNAHWQSVATERQTVSMMVNDAARTSDDTWEPTRDKATKRIDNYEAMVAKLDDDL